MPADQLCTVRLDWAELGANLAHCTDDKQAAFFNTFCAELTMLGENLT